MHMRACKSVIQSRRALGSCRRLALLAPLPAPTHLVHYKGDRLDACVAVPWPGWQLGHALAMAHALDDGLPRPWVAMLFSCSSGL